MRTEAEAHAEEDVRRKELIEARNAADNAAYAAEKALREFGDKIPADLKSNVEDHVAKVREVMDSEDAESIKSATEALNEVIQQIGAAAYQQAGPEVGTPGEGEPEAGPESAPGDEDEDVVDGEFRNV
jgi:molecular chaperone DnaK